jgi:hypothetical protein
MATLEQILENYYDEDFLIADGFDDAVIGVEINSMRLIYSVSKCLEILQEHMSEEDAIEYFEYNVSSAYVGEQTPIWCYDNF